MVKIAFVIFNLLLGAVPTLAQQMSAPADGEALRQAIAGRTVYVVTPLGVELPIRYHANGTMTSKSSAHLASMAGESTHMDYGRWWVANGRLCQRWQNWLSRQSYCYEMTITGNEVTWRRNDGRTGTARLGS
jgi:hypothetical protein